jgi:hypothetical protein
MSPAGSGVYPACAELESGDDVKFMVLAGASVWSVEQPDGGDAIDPSGNYREPEGEGTFQISASVAPNDGTTSSDTL